MLALDWAKAFDSINPEVLVSALRRLGVGEMMATLISNVYQQRKFREVDEHQLSSERLQSAGVA